MRIWFLKGSTGKSKLFGQLCRGSHYAQPQTLMVDMVGVPFTLAENVCLHCAMDATIDNVKQILKDVHEECPDIRDLYIYGNFPEELVKSLKEVAEPYAQQFDIWFTIQTKKGGFELEPYNPISY